jgi:hypothetical protein
VSEATLPIETETAVVHGVPGQWPIDRAAALLAEWGDGEVAPHA